MTVYDLIEKQYPNIFKINLDNPGTEFSHRRNFFYISLVVTAGKQFRKDIYDEAVLRHELSHIVEIEDHRLFKHNLGMTPLATQNINAWKKYLSPQQLLKAAQREIRVNAIDIQSELNYKYERDNGWNYDIPDFFLLYQSYELNKVFPKYDDAKQYMLDYYYTFHKSQWNPHRFHQELKRKVTLIQNYQQLHNNPFYKI